MNKDKTKILLVCEDGNASLETAAGTIQSTFSQTHEVKLRLASAVSIQEVLAADCYIFAVGKADSEVWKELRRLFKGINLAGRRVAFLSGAKGESAILREAFKDASLSVSDPDFLVRKNADLVSWARRVLTGT